MSGGTVAWEVTTAGPKRLEHKQIGKEADLETWILKDPNLIEPGLAILARQRTTSTCRGGTVVAASDGLGPTVPSAAKGRPRSKWTLAAHSVLGGNPSASPGRRGGRVRPHRTPAYNQDIRRSGIPSWRV